MSWKLRESLRRARTDNPVSARVLLLPIGAPSRVVKIDSGLKAMQDLVGGDIQAVYLDRRLALFVNEYGVLDHLPQNRPAPPSVASQFLGGWIQGPAFLCREDADGESIGLTDDDIRVWSPIFEKTLTCTYGGCIQYALRYGGTCSRHS